jgi:hypothetical protein
MTKDFYVCARWSMKAPGAAGPLAGGIVYPCGIPRPTLDRRNLSKTYPHLRRRLFDPQLYLAGLNPARATRACTNLASYGWFGVNLPRFDSSKFTQAEWKGTASKGIAKDWKGGLPEDGNEIQAIVDTCVSFQRDLGCEAVILPGPLTVSLSDDYERELIWLDAGLKAASKLSPGLQAWPTVAISDTCLRGQKPISNRLLDVIVDQITARGCAGVYLVLEQANEQGAVCSHSNTLGSVLRLVGGLAQGRIRVTVSHLGMAGLLALAAGASAWTTGWYRGERRLKLADFEGTEGRTVPTFYSHALASDIHLESDMDRLVEAGFLDRVQDETGASAGLLRAIATGTKVASVPEWKHSFSNVTAAKEHYVWVAARETAVLAQLKTQTEVDTYMTGWLDGAEQLMNDLFAVGNFHDKTGLGHQATWRQVWATFQTERDS